MFLGGRVSLQLYLWRRGRDSNSRGHLRTPNDLANRPLQPLGYLSVCLAEGVGFEPTKLSLAGFPDRYLQPLGHPSILGQRTVVSIATNTLESQMLQ